MSLCVILISSSLSYEMCSISLELCIVYLPECICWVVKVEWIGSAFVVVCTKQLAGWFSMHEVKFSFPNFDNRFLWIVEAFMVHPLTKCLGWIANSPVWLCSHWFIDKVMFDNGVHCVHTVGLCPLNCGSHGDVRLRFYAITVVIFMLAFIKYAQMKCAFVFIFIVRYIIILTVNTLSSFSQNIFPMFPPFGKIFHFKLHLWIKSTLLCKTLKITI